MAQTLNFTKFPSEKLKHFPNVITGFMVIMVLYSCSKENVSGNNPPPPPPPPPVSPPGSLSFSIQGTAFNWKEERDTASVDYLEMAIYPDGNSYTLNAGTNLKPNRPYRLVNLPLQTSTLSVNTPFTYTNNANFTNLAAGISIPTTTNPNVSVDYRAFPGDRVIIAITKIQNNRANGTFSAELTRISDTSKVPITQGIFENIRITQ